MYYLIIFILKRRSVSQKSVEKRSKVRQVRQTDEEKILLHE